MKDSRPVPIRSIVARAPVRICDNGGWTDTWFAKYGKVFNIAVTPLVEARVEAFAADALEGPVILRADNYKQEYVRQPGTPWQHHPLLEACLEAVRIPAEISLWVSIGSGMPPGAATGTSAAVAVALLGALDRLTPGSLSPMEAARLAHAVETEILGQQSGLQDQLCAAFGGINFIDIYEYPHARVERVRVPDEVLSELERRLILIYLGKPHHSSQVHEEVINNLKNAGPDAPELAPLRATASASAEALCKGNFVELGALMTRNTEAQAGLHAALVSNDARRVIEIAREYGAPGCKVNGAGGEGGSLTVLGPDEEHTRRSLIEAIENELPKCGHIPVALCLDGLRVQG